MSATHSAYSRFNPFQAKATQNGLKLQERRGPFRPERLLAVHQTPSWPIFWRLFRITDIVFLTVLGLGEVIRLSPVNLWQGRLGDFIPIATGVFLALKSMQSFGLYHFERRESLYAHLCKLYLALLLGLLSLVGLAFITGAPYRIETFKTMSMLAGLGLGGLHTIWYLIVRGWRDKGFMTPNIVLVGATRYAEKIIKTGLSCRDVNILGVFDDRLARSPRDLGGVPVLGSINDLMAHKITPFVDHIVIAVDPSARTRLKDLTERLKALPNAVSLIVDAPSEDLCLKALKRLGDQPLTRVSGISRNQSRAIYKRLQDLIIGSLALILFAPFMVILAIWIRLDSPGPVFFRQIRHGFNNQPIRVWKFRSMRIEMTDATAAVQVQAKDQRITRLGRFIRRTSLDELPQLFNVLDGDMSLVGPRPHAIGMKTGHEDSARLVADYAWRHRIKPGMTGWAAIHGSRGPLNSAEDVRRRVSYDVEYIERQNIWLDLYIMAMTVPCLLGDRDAVR